MNKKAAEFASDVRVGVVGEWHTRTTFGKLLFPVWLVYSVCIWVLVLSLLAGVAVFTMYFKAFDTPAETGTSLTPAIHKDERECAGCGGPVSSESGNGFETSKCGTCGHEVTVIDRDEVDA